MHIYFVIEDSNSFVASKFVLFSSRMTTYLLLGNISGLFFFLLLFETGFPVALGPVLELAL